MNIKNKDTIRVNCYHPLMKKHLLFIGRAIKAAYCWKNRWEILRERQTENGLKKVHEKKKKTRKGSR